MIDVMDEKDTYLSSFSEFEKQLGAKTSSWPHALRAAAIERFAELGFPGPRDEEWKFTSLAALRETPFRLAPASGAGLSDALLERLAFETGGHRVVFVNGRYAPELSTQAASPAGLTVASL